MRTGNLSIAAHTTIRASRQLRIPHLNRQKPESSVEPAARDRRHRPLRHPLPAPDHAHGHGMRLRKHGRSSRRTVLRSVPVMFRSSADNRPENRLAPTAFPAGHRGHRIAADPPPPVRRRRRHQTEAAERAVRGITDSAAGISSKTTAQAPIAPAVLRSEFPLAIPSVRRITRAAVFRRRLRRHHNRRAVRDPATGSGNQHETSGFEFPATAVVVARQAAPAHHRAIPVSTVTHAAVPDARCLPAGPQRPTIPVNHHHPQRRAIPTTVKAFVAGNGMEPHGFSSPQLAQSSVRAIPHHRSPELRTVRFSRCAVPLPSAAVRSLVMNGTCPSLVSVFVSPRFTRRCTWSRLVPAAGNGPTSSTAVTSRS